MNSQLKWKFVFILAVLLVCIYGVIGLSDFSHLLDPAETESRGSHQARPRPEGRQPPCFAGAGGGSHRPALRSDRRPVSKQLHDKNIGFGEIRRVDDTHILVRNVDPATSGSFRDLVNNQFTDWTMAPAAGENERLSADHEAQRGLRSSQVRDGSVARNHHAPHQRARTHRTDDRFHRPRR